MIWIATGNVCQRLPELEPGFPAALRGETAQTDIDSTGSRAQVTGGVSQIGIWDLQPEWECWVSCISKNSVKHRYQVLKPASPAHAPDKAAELSMHQNNVGSVLPGQIE